MIFLKRTLPLVIAFVVGVVMILKDYVPHRASENLSTVANNWFLIVSGFAVILGLYSLLHLHAVRIKRQVPGWGYSFLVYVGVFAMVFFGLLKEFEVGVAAISGGAWAPDLSTWSLDVTGAKVWPDDGLSPVYTWMYNWIYTQSSAAVFSILAFYIASAAFRTFVARTPEAAILLVAAIVVMMGQVPLGGLIHDRIPWLADRIMDTPNLAAKRGILLGISLGAISTSLRIIFGIERAYLGGGE